MAPSAGSSLPFLWVASTGKIGCHQLSLKTAKFSWRGHRSKRLEDKKELVSLLHSFVNEIDKKGSWYPWTLPGQYTSQLWHDYSQVMRASVRLAEQVIRTRLGLRSIARVLDTAGDPWFFFLNIWHRILIFLMASFSKKYLHTTSVYTVESHNKIFFI